MYIEKDGTRRVGHYDRILGYGYYQGVQDNTRWYNVRPLTVKEFMDVVALEHNVNSHREAVAEVVNSLIKIRNEARENKNYKVADEIRDLFILMGFKIEDGTG